MQEEIFWMKEHMVGLVPVARRNINAGEDWEGRTHCFGTHCSHPFQIDLKSLKLS